MYNSFDGMGLCEGRRHSTNYVIAADEISVAAAVAVAHCICFVRFWLAARPFVGAVSDVVDDAVAADVDAMVVGCSIVLWWEFRCLLEVKMKKKYLVILILFNWLRLNLI